MNKLPKSKRRVMAAGFVALDAISVGDRYAHRAGGTASNVAANLAYFGWGADIVGLIGTDGAGRLLRRDLVDARVGVDHLHLRDNVATPVVIHEIEAGRHRFRFSCPKCGRKFPKARPLPRAEVNKVVRCAGLADVFFFDRRSAAAVMLAELHAAAGRMVVFEPSSRGVQHLFKRAVETAHIVKVSDERMGAAELPKSRAVRIVTHGSRGLSIWAGRDKRQLSTAALTSVVDAGGAGDWTTAAFLTKLPTLDPTDLGLESLVDALKLAQMVGAISCLFPGARGLASAFSAERLLELAARLEVTTSELASAQGASQLPKESCRICVGATVAANR